MGAVKLKSESTRNAGILRCAQNDRKELCDSPDAVQGGRPEEDGVIVRQLRRQAALFSRLEGLAHRQRMLVAQEDTRPLLVLLAERQKIVVELTEVSRQLAPARSEWTTVRQTLSPVDRLEADGLLDQMQQALGRVLAGDEEDARCLAIRKQMVRRELQHSKFSGAAVGAYRNGPAMAGRRLDEQR